jgi:hypothetical protein
MFVVFIDTFNKYVHSDYLLIKHVDIFDFYRHVYANCLLHRHVRQKRFIVRGLVQLN